MNIFQCNRPIRVNSLLSSLCSSFFSIFISLYSSFLSHPYSPLFTLHQPLYINYQTANYYLLDWRARQAVFASSICHVRCTPCTYTKWFPLLLCGLDASLMLKRIHHATLRLPLAFRVFAPKCFSIFTAFRQLLTIYIEIICHAYQKLQKSRQ